MRLLSITLVLVASTTGIAYAIGPDPSPTTYWQIRGCQHHHLEKKARHEIVERTRSPLVLTRARWKQVWHFAVCVKHRSSHLRLHKLIKTEMRWRRSHEAVILAQRFAVMFAEVPAWGKAHLASIAECESGGDPTAVSGSGAYRGKYQFSFSTWSVVGGSGDPAKAPESEQDWRAWLLLRDHGAGHWPVCG